MNGILLLLTLVLFLYALIKPKEALLAAIFLAPWQGLRIDIGLTVTAYRLIMAVLVITCAMRVSISRTFKFEKHSFVHVLFFIFVGYVIVRSVLQMPLLPNMHIRGGFFRYPLYRALGQIVMFLLQVSPVLVIPLIFRRVEDIWLAGKIYLYSTIILAGLGWFQIICWYATGWDPFPIGLIQSFFSNSMTSKGIINFAGYNLYRMNSFGGEPKGLGQSLSMGLVLIQVVLDKSHLVEQPKRLKQVWIFLFISMLLTYSTSAIYLWILGTLTLGLLNLVSEFRRKAQYIFVRWITTTSFLLIIVMLVVSVGISTLGLKLQRFNIIDLVKERTVERNTFEDFDATIINFLSDQPSFIWEGVGLGNVNLYAMDYIPPYAARYMYGTSFVAKSGYLRLLSETGLLGLFLFLTWVVVETRCLTRQTNLIKRFEGYGTLLLLATVVNQSGIIFTICYLARGYVANQAFLSLGTVVAFRGILYNKIRGLKSK